MGFISDLFSSPSPPPTPAPLPAPIASQTKPVDDTSKQVREARMKTRKQAIAALGREDTIFTGSQGLSSPVTTQKKTLLGQ